MAKTLTFTVSPEVWQAVKDKADKSGQSVNQWLRRLVEREVRADVQAETGKKRQEKKGLLDDLFD